MHSFNRIMTMIKVSTDNELLGYRSKVIKEKIVNYIKEYFLLTT